MGFFCKALPVKWYQQNKNLYLYLLNFRLILPDYTTFLQLMTLRPGFPRAGKATFVLLKTLRPRFPRIGKATFVHLKTHRPGFPWPPKATLQLKALTPQFWPTALNGNICTGKDT